MEFVPNLVFHRLREARNFIRIIRGKLTGDHETRVEALEAALDELESEKRIYESELRRARAKLQQRDSSSGEQDISAI